MSEAYGPLLNLNRIRPDLVTRVVDRSIQGFNESDLEHLLAEALFTEKSRLRRRDKGLTYLFTAQRRHRDLDLWRNVSGKLVKEPSGIETKDQVERVLRHYSEEIAGRFKPGVYEFATGAIPFGFRWLLNALSVKNFIPWGMKASIEDRIQIQGEVEQLQKLCKKGTVLLVPTHMSNIDSILIGYVIYMMQLPPFSYGAGLNLYSNPILSFFMSSLGAYTVDRKKQNRIYKETLKNYSTEILKEGIHSVFFPAGGRVRSGAIENHLKLGLLGTGIQAQIDNLIDRKPNPKIFVVPMVTSYHFVLEAIGLIEDYLLAEGQSRFLGADVQENPLLVNIGRFIWKFFSSETSVTVRIGKALDVFGNNVDEDGNSIGPSGQIVDQIQLLKTQGELKSVPQRDHEYTRHLGSVIADRFYENNTVLSSHLVAFAYFRTLRERYPNYDLFRFLRLSSYQRQIPLRRFYEEADQLFQEVRAHADQGKLFLSPELRQSGTKKWVRDGVRNLGLLHDAAVVRIQNNTVNTDDMNLLYYYRNRLTGYGFSFKGSLGRPKILRGEPDEFGFLA